MTLEEAAAHVGERVRFTYGHGETADGTISSTNAKYVFVRFDRRDGTRREPGETAEGCEADQLELLTGAPCVVADHDRLIRLLAATDPTYDCICCFFCASSAPHHNPSTGESPAEDHDADCPWWIARRMLRLPQWPEEAR